ncbi:MAG: hypothetical protein FWD36_07520 [Treponema sp.]|nr:hypothetical protein [Treponema sp.]
MKIHTLYTIILSLGILAAVSCNQDPIFYTISKEPPPQEPLIKGGPTNMVVFHREYHTPDPAAVSKSALKAAITNAQSLHNVIILSADGSELPDGTEWAQASALDDFQTAINDAELVHGNIAATRAEFDAATAALNNARTAFIAEINTVPGGTVTDAKDILEAAIDKAEKLYDSVIESEDGTDVAIGANWAPETILVTFRNAIDEAIAIFEDPDAGQIVITNEVTALKNAIDTFEKTIVIRVPILYAASGNNLYWYAKANRGTGNSRWNLGEYHIPQPGGKIIALAVTNNRLYALSLEGNNVNATLRYIERNTNHWTSVGSGSLQSIHADPEQPWLFASARSGSSYVILYLNNNTDTLELIADTGNTEMLSGAVYRDNIYYLSTQGKGVFQVAIADLENNLAQIEQLTETTTIEGAALDNNRMFMSMIKLEDDMIIAVERKDGYLYEIKNNKTFEKMRYADGTQIATGNYATGALALWQEFPAPTVGRKMLIAGVQGSLFTTISSSHTHGYVEFVLHESNGAFHLDPIHRSIKPNITVHNNTDRYTATIGKHPLNHLFQAPEGVDSNILFFASTQSAGLWSYKERPGSGLQWNAEN